MKKKMAVVALAMFAVVGVGRVSHELFKGLKAARVVDACVETSMRSGVSEAQSYKDCAK
jgi:hypothetical protein